MRENPYCCGLPLPLLLLLLVLIPFPMFPAAAFRFRNRNDPYHIISTKYQRATISLKFSITCCSLVRCEEVDEEEEEEEEEEEVEKIVPTIERTETEDMQTGSVLGLCTPRSKPANPKPVPENNERDPFSLIEKMLGCNFLVHDLDDDYSDGETFANNTYNTFDDTLTMGNESTFDSLSDGEYKRAIRRKRRSRRK
mmetsp:Transcript_21352/g.50548  ORF Transcript_21352/g.50548 Transcript_21352/m.50548 type:complete len:196 (+) Transcript_21352:1423-2010(+)